MANEKREAKKAAHIEQQVKLVAQGLDVLMTRASAAAYLGGLSLRTIDRHIEQGHLTKVSLSAGTVRITADSVRQFAAHGVAQA